MADEGKFCHEVEHTYGCDSTLAAAQASISVADKASNQHLVVG